MFYKLIDAIKKKNQTLKLLEIWKYLFSDSLGSWPPFSSNIS